MLLPNSLEVLVAARHADLLREAAIARLASHPFHLVVSDVKLPKLDGLALLRRIRKEFPATEVLLMTAYGSVDDAVTAMKDSAVDYLTKPFNIDQLVNVVGRIDDRLRPD